MPETNLLGFTPTTGITDDIRKKSESFISNQGYMPSSNMFGDLGTTTSKKQLSLMDTINSQPMDNNIGGETGISRQDSVEQLSDGSYIDKYKDYYVGTDNNERLAQQQTTGEKWANGLAKFGGKTFTAVLGGTIGVVDSLVEGIAKGSLSEGYNSKFNRKLDDLNTEMDYKLPSLYTEQERNAGFFGQMTQANFYADKILGGASFMTGAIVSEALWGLATGGTGNVALTESLLAKASRWTAEGLGGESKVVSALAKMKDYAKGLTQSAIKTEAIAGEGALMGEFSANAINKTVKNFNYAKIPNIVLTATRSAGFEAGMEARLYMKQTEANWLDRYQKENGYEPTSEEYADFKNTLTNSANAVFLANMPILAVSNGIQFKNALFGTTVTNAIKNSTLKRTLFGLGYNTVEKAGERTLEAIASTKGQRILGKTWGLGRDFFTEGYEEMAQGVVSGTADNYMMNGYNRDKTKSTYDTMDAFSDAVIKQFGTTEGLTEGFIGGLTGVLGNVAGGSVRTISNKDAKFNLISQERENLQKQIDYSNQFTAKNLLDNVVANNRMQGSQELKDRAVNKKDMVGARLADMESSLAIIDRNKAIGGLESGVKDFQFQIEHTDLKEVKEQLGLDTEEQAKAFLDQKLQEHKDLVVRHSNNLDFATALLGEQDFASNDKTLNTRDMQRAIAHQITMGQEAHQVNNDLISHIKSIVAEHVSTEGVSDAFDVQQVLEQAPKDKLNTINKLKVEKTNLTNRLKTLQVSLLEAGKIKDKEGATTRQDKLVDISQQIQETEQAVQKNTDDRQTALDALGITDNKNITVESFDNQQANVAKLKSTIDDIQRRNPEQHLFLKQLLAQQSKAVQHAKNYDTVVKAINDPKTRVKLLDGWLSNLLNKNTKLNESTAAHFTDILNNFKKDTIITFQETTQTKQQKKFEAGEEVDEKYIENLRDLVKLGQILDIIDQKILDKVDGNEVASMEAPKEENTEKPVNQLQVLRDKVKELTSTLYDTQYIGDVLSEANRHKPKDSDVEEYETLLSKWNRKAEKSLARIISRPSDYKYKDLGLNTAEINRLKELNTLLGNWMSFVGTDAGNSESVADLLQRINLLEQAINTQEIKTELSDKDIKLVVESTELEAKSVGSQYRGLQTGTDVLAIIKQKENTITFSHIKTASLSSIFPNSSMLINNNGTFEININGRTLTGKENGKGGQVMNLEDWNSFKKESNVLIKDFGNVYNAVSQFIGFDSQGKELYKTLESDFTYDQLGGSSIKINSDEVNKTKKGELVDLFISTQDVYNSKLDPKNINSDLHIYVMKNGNLIGSVPRGYSDEDPNGLGVPLRDLRKNSLEFLKNTGLKGLVKLPYKMEAGIIIVGTPYITLQKDENGDVTIKQNEFTKDSLQNVVGTGYSLNGEVVSKVNVDVKQFARKLGEENKDKKVPLIIANIEGKTIAFPVNLKSQIVDMSAPIIEANNLRDTDKLNIILQTLVDNNIDPNSFGINFSSPDWVTQEQELENVLKALQNVTVYKNIDDFASKNYDLRSLKNDATIAIELDKTPFASSKIMLQISSKLDTDVLGYTENLAKIEEKRFAIKTTLNEVIKEIYFEFNKNLALENFNNKFITTLSENPLYEGTADVILSKNINALKIAIKGMSQTTKNIVGVDLIDNARYLIKEIEFYNSEAKKTKSEIDNSKYYTDVNQDFITVNEDGELNNPYILESQVIRELGGIKNKTEFNEALEKSDFESLKNGTQLNLFEELSDFNRILVTELVDGKLVTKKDDKVAQTIMSTLVDDENGIVRAVLSDLEGLSNKIWSNNPKQVKTLLKNIEEKAIEISLDLKGLEKSYDAKSQTEIMDIIRALDFLLNNVNDQSLNHFVEVYEDFMGLVKEDLIAVEKVGEKFKNKPLIKVEGKESDYKLFKENGLLRVKGRVFLKTDSNKMILKDIEALMQANKMEISEDDMKEQMFKEPTEDAEYNDEDLKKLINYRKYFGAENVQKETVEIRVPQQIENEEYLSTDFIGDMRKLQLENQSNRALQNLEFSDKGITLISTDEISIAEMNQYLEENQDLKNYFLLNRNANFEIAQDNIIVSERDLIVNGKILPQFQDNFRKINSNVIQAQTNENFIRIGKDNYEKVSDDLFSKLPVNESNFYITEVEQPILNVNVSDYINQKNSPKIEIKNKYSQKESEQIDDDIDCSKNK